MAPPSYKLHATTDSPAIYDPARFDEVLPVVRAPRTDDTPRTDDMGDESYRYGFRERWEKMPDGSGKLRRIPLTYEDTLNPQLGDRVSTDTIHTKLTGNISGILEMRYEDDPTVAVWSDLKVRSPSGGKGKGKRRKKGTVPLGGSRGENSAEGAKGPSPDVCVVGGVRDRDRRRESFELPPDD